MTSPQLELRDLPSILFVEHLVTILHRSAPTVRRLIRRGEFGPHGRVAGRLYVRRDSLLEHLADQEVPVDAPRTKAKDPSVRKYEEMLWGKKHGSK